MATAHRLNQHDAPAAEPDTRHIDLLQQILDTLSPIAEHARIVLAEQHAAKKAATTEAPPPGAD